MDFIILILHILTALSVIALVLLQHGKGADMGAAFGSGSSGSLFGASGSSNFLSRATAILAAVFFLTSMFLTYLSFDKTETSGLMSDYSENNEQDINKQDEGQENASSNVKNIPE